jgi:ribosomal-protein-alanine N-acetyltransferase
MIRLETARLLLRDHEPDDLEPYCEMESDPEYRRPQPVHPRTELERSFRETWLPPKAMGLLATVFKPDGRYIGRCGLYPFRTDAGDPIPGEASLAFYLARPYWGRGLATEAGRALVAHGFGELGLTRIHAGINAANRASQRVVEKLGFRVARAGEGGGNRWYDFELANPDETPER